ncbi:beta-glucosidase family protein [Haloglomus litoreum]|uniref:beta-glucosidase family protein n=1 Tax=Haloglomus litoreum TaxID=3034026 RepID=UPI0023E7BB92|nr:glycoside hydrolase family 3 C-terminal domain-containing protein [Haloglomus sp. DT116]
MTHDEPGTVDDERRAPVEAGPADGGSEQVGDDGTGMARRGFLSAAGGSIAAAVLGAGTAGADHGTDSDASTDRSPEELVAAMTLDEKLNLVNLPFNNDSIDPTPRLGIPELGATDGPLGVRHENQNRPDEEGCIGFDAQQPATAFPAPIAQASTFDPGLVRQFGRAVAREGKALNQEIWFGPGMNIVRVPELGRAFEYYGEDPYLSSRMAVAAVEAAQANGLIATAKHFVANNQEGSPPIDSQCDTLFGPTFVARRNARHYVNAVVGERALREIYMPAFRAAVEEADIGGVMSAYNRVNGTYCGEHRDLLLDTLKEEWGFEGFVVSDAGGSRPRSAQNGLDVELQFGPVFDFFDEALKRQVQTGVVEEATLDDKVLRLLRQVDRMGILDGDRPGAPPAVNTDEHQRLARRIAAEGTVLLQNEPVAGDDNGDAAADPALPLDLDAIDHVAVIGHRADEAKLGGGGSSNVTPPYSVSPLEAVREYVDDRAEVSFERGQDSTAAAADLAVEADVALVFGNGSSTEGTDRNDIQLNGNQNALVADVAAANDHTVVVLNTGGPVTMPWIDDVPAVLQMWYPGMEDGHAATDVLFDEVAPGGKLPVTFGKERGDYPASEQQQYPGIAGRAEYTEGVFVGYRYFDDRANEPLFPFGHGLSYTEFAYSDLRVEAEGPTEATVEVTVENVGDHAGTEVPQVYVHDQGASVPRPPKELKAFEKVELAPGESTTVAFALDADAFSYYDDRDADDWVVEPGFFSILVGSSSRDIRAVEPIHLSGDGLTTLSPTVTRTDDGSVFTGGATNQVELDVEADRSLLVRDRIPVDWTVVGGDVSVEQLGDRKLVQFDGRHADGTLSYFVEAPSGENESESAAFGPVEVSLDGESWTPVAGSGDETLVVGADGPF